MSICWSPLLSLSLADCVWRGSSEVSSLWLKLRTGEARTDVTPDIQSREILLMRSPLQSFMYVNPEDSGRYKVNFIYLHFRVCIIIKWFMHHVQSITNRIVFCYNQFLNMEIRATTPTYNYVLMSRMFIPNQYYSYIFGVWQKYL